MVIDFRNEDCQTVWNMELWSFLQKNHRKQAKPKLFARAKSWNPAFMHHDIVSYSSHCDTAMPKTHKRSLCSTSFRMDLIVEKNI